MTGFLEVMRRAIRWLLVILCPAATATAREVPSFLIVLADDLGRDAVGYTGAHPDAPPTPNLDRLAAECVRFRRAYASPLCSPTRGMLITGRLPWRTGVGNVIQSKDTGGGLDLDADTIAHALGPAWRRVVLGKWHLSHYLQIPADPPAALGFDAFRGSWFNLNPGGQSYWRWWKSDGAADAPHLVYATTDTVDDAVRELRAGTAPLFLLVHLHAPHSPFHAAPADLAGPPGGDRTPDLFATMVEAMDRELGRLLTELEASAYADETWVFFLGDNGTPQAAVRPPSDPRKAKTTVYEGGIRVPLVVRGPGTRPADVEGPVMVTDLYSTIAELAGVASRTPDSVSMVPWLLGTAGPRRDHVYVETFGPYFSSKPFWWKRAVVEERYKLIDYNDPPSTPERPDELYDLLLDPEEEHDALAGGPDGLEGDLRRAYLRLRRRLDAQGGGLYD